MKPSCRQKIRTTMKKNIMTDRSKISLKNGFNKRESKQYLVDVERKTKEMGRESEKMEKENVLMERKISALKEKLGREKEERERMGGTRWQSSQVRKTQAKPRGPRQIKVLTDEPIENYKNKFSKPTDFRLCGQCEYKRAKVLCKECHEYYCSSCYKQFHSKGALRKHSWEPVQCSQAIGQATETESVSQSSERSSNSTRTEVMSVSGIALNKSPTNIGKKPPCKSPTNIGKKPPCKSPTSSKDSSCKSPAYHKRNSSVQQQDNEEIFSQNLNASRTSSSFKESDGTISLLDGCYDEKESTQSFQEALLEWRNAGEKKENSSPDVDQEIKRRTASVGSDQPIETPSSSNTLRLNIKLNSSMSYMDKLMLKRSRKEPQIFTERPLYTTTKATTPITQEEDTGAKQSVFEEEIPSARDLVPPSSCILTVDYSPFCNESHHQPSCIDVDISPIENGEYNEEESEVCSSPVISCEQPTPSDACISTDTVDTVETHTLNQMKDEGYDIDEAVMPSRKAKSKYSYQDMHEYYTIGVEMEKCGLDQQNINFTSSLDDNFDESNSVISNKSSIWKPGSSYYIESDISSEQCETDNKVNESR